jgi:class 3 adenylate cyclase
MVAQLLILLLIQFLVIFPYSLFGESIQTSKSLSGNLIGKYITFLEDSSSKLSISDILSNENQLQFKQSNTDTFNFGHTNHSYWLKLEFNNDSDKKLDQILYIDYNNIDEVEFFSPVETQNGIQFKSVKAGMNYPFHLRERDHRNFLFNINVEAGNSKTYYLKLKTMGGLIAPLYLWNEKEFLIHDSKMQQGLGFYFGIMFVMLLYNLFIFISVKDISYLFYIGYIFGLSGIQLVLTGLGFQYIWFDSTWLQQNLYAIFSTICMSSALLFARSFLNIKEISKFLNKSIHIFVLSNVAVFFCIFIFPRNLVIISAIIVTVPSVILSIVCGIVSFQKKYRPARYYLLAFSMLILSGLFVILKFLNVIESSFLTDYGLYIGSCLEVVLLSFALASRINTIKREKEEAQAKTLEMQKILTESYARFVPKDFLANLGKESILDVRLGDQIQKDMAVLFSDIRSFTTLSEKLTPAENFNFINSYLGRMSPIIQRNFGFIDKFIGDAIMALFDKSALDAVRAGIQMQLYLKEYNSYRNNRGYDPIEIGIGIHTGSLMLGTIGAEERLEGTVISDTVNLASRIENLTKVYGSKIAVSEETVEEVKKDGKFSFRFLDRVKVKGKVKPVSIYEIIDGDESEIRELKFSSKSDYDKAIKFYYEKEYKKAKESFDRVIQLHPNDRVSQLYLKRLYALENNITLPA